MLQRHVLRIKIVKVPIDDVALFRIAHLVFGFPGSGVMIKNDTISKPILRSVLAAIRPQSGPSNGNPSMYPARTETPYLCQLSTTRPYFLNTRRCESSSVSLSRSSVF